MTPTTPPTPPTSSRVALARSKVLNLVFTEDADKEAVREAVDELERLAYQCGAEATRQVVRSSGHGVGCAACDSGLRW